MGTVLLPGFALNSNQNQAEEPSPCLSQVKPDPLNYAKLKLAAAGFKAPAVYLDGFVDGDEGVGIELEDNFF
jgi:hypothetical protein